ncbi:MAG TPA: hypothetical protein VNW24_07990, partial [Stellaceae bacterium]|nr:hypothetical protein [Stellaceae bacterium]
CLEWWRHPESCPDGCRLQLIPLSPSVTISGSAPVIARTAKDLGSPHLARKDLARNAHSGRRRYTRGANY